MRPMWVWTITAVLLVAGGTWLATLVWKTSALGGQTIGPQLVGAALAGLTIARFAAYRRRWHAPALAVTGVAVWVGIALAHHVVRDAQPVWAATFTGPVWSHYAVVGSLSLAIAAATGAIRFRPMEHWLEWIWVSGLLMLGTIVMCFVTTTDRNLPALAVIAMLGAPIGSGALTQYLAPRRMIWTCGGGAVLFMLLVIDGGLSKGHAIGDAFGALLGCSIFLLLGALGARVGWWAFRRRELAPAEIPTARAS